MYNEDRKLEFHREDRTFRQAGTESFFYKVIDFTSGTRSCECSMSNINFMITYIFMQY